MGTPVDRLRDAWKTGDRLALHREAELLASEGTSLDALDAAVNTLLLEARAAGVDEDAEEVILGVGDRLNGWCNPDRQISARPNTALSTTNGTPASTDRPVSPA